MLSGRQRIDLQEGIVAVFTASDWKLFGVIADIEEWVDGHGRLLRSLSFGDDDYDGHVLVGIDTALRKTPANVHAFLEFRRLIEWLRVQKPSSLAAIEEESKSYAPPWPASRERLVRLHRAVCACFSASDWHRLGVLCDNADVITDHHRLLRSLDWGDPDYDGNAMDVLRTLLDSNAAGTWDALRSIPSLQEWLNANDPELLNPEYDESGSDSAEAPFPSSDVPFGAVADAFDSPEVPFDWPAVSADEEQSQAAPSSSGIAIRTETQPHSAVASLSSSGHPRPADADLPASTPPQGTTLQAIMAQIRELDAGAADAYTYHVLVSQLLSLVFEPDLTDMKREDALNQGRKRVDITFTNRAVAGFFAWFPFHYGPTPNVFVEVKNYTQDPANPELDQLAGRLAPRRGRLGLLVCRTVSNHSLMTVRCRDRIDDDKYILVIDDSDLEALLLESDRLGTREAVFLCLKRKLDNLVK